MTTPTTRCALIGGAGVAAVAAPTVPDEPFARTWLAQWTNMGGSCLPNLNGDGWLLGWPEYDCSPAHDDDRATHDGPDNQDYSAYAYARYDGHMRGLCELLQSFPSGKDAVQALVATDPQLGRMRARKAVV